ncbi:phytanoyl-CoA dioxygenase family protein [Leptospira wolffii]|uniref:Phytanoyl-CoA dioxygenase family protein n=1 Tax=Leptospira wolffii TaxID=409998 RepID=A0ABV5BTD1_9LEPT|nr:phytanoyl-CoA dioxygenase family protein [Leptospira wolffii]TGL55366.1 deoxygenase [Leptospira wolffii]
MTDLLTYPSLGFQLFPGFFSDSELKDVREIFLEADSRFRKEYPDPRSVNSAYLTSPKFCPEAQNRLRLFQFVSQKKLVELAENLIEESVYFLNTQLFFNPESEEKKNYWHRDMQYLGVSEEEQKIILKRDKVLHFRIPFFSDPGMEFIPRSHLRWDREIESDTRLERNGRKNSDPLPETVRIPQEPGDLLVFSAHLIHRGIYGGERRSLDLLYTNFRDKKSSSETFRHFPNEKELLALENPNLFEQAD